MLPEIRRPQPFPISSRKEDSSPSGSGSSLPPAPCPELVPGPIQPTSDDGGAQETPSKHVELSPVVPYEIGYGRPPRSGQFKKGQRANPRGRPKGAKSAMTIFREEAEVLITVRENGRTKKMSKLRVGIRNVMNNLAAKPDLRSMLAFLKLLNAAQGPNFEIEAQKTSGEEEALFLSKMAEDFMRELAGYDAESSAEIITSRFDE